MKYFAEFVSSISSEDVAAISSKANSMAIEVRDNTDPSDSDFLGNQIGAISYSIALSLLERYHKWLSQPDPD